MIEFFSSFLEEYIPDKKSKWILVLSISLSTFLFVSPGEGLKLLSITQTQQIELLTKWAVPPSIVLVGLVLAYHWTCSYYRSSINLNHWKFHENVILTIGEYYEAKKEDKLIVKITLKDISTQEMPTIFSMPPSNSNNADLEAATLSFCSSFMYHGKYVKKIESHVSQNEESFVMSTYQFPEEESSVFFFHIENSTKGERFFRCIVKHINSHKQEVELDVYFLSLNDD